MLRGSINLQWPDQSIIVLIAMNCFNRLIGKIVTNQKKVKIARFHHADGDEYTCMKDKL